jgi:uncharacterized membrane protein
MPASDTSSVWPLIGRALVAAAIGAGAMTLVAEMLDWYWLRFYLIELGALAGFGWSLQKHWQNRFAALEGQVNQLSQRRPVESAAQPATPTPEPVKPPPVTTPAETAVSKQFERMGVSTSPASTAAPAKPSWQEKPTQPLEPSLLSRGVDEAVAWFKRGNPMARIGIVVLFFGGAFLARYAAESGFFPIEVRLMGLAAGAMVLLGIGWRLREKNRNYGLILQGGGIAVLYLTVFAALKLYQLIEPGFALPIMIVIALAAAVLSVAQNALVLAVIGFTGGFLAPILTSTGGGSHIALFSYYTVLNLGIFTIAWFRAWRVLNLVGFIFTFGIAGTFRALSYQPEDLLSTDFFLLLFFVMYVAISVLFSLRQPPKLKGYVSGSLVFGLPVATFALHASLVSHLEFGLAWSALGFGLFYLALAIALYLSRNPNLRLLAEAFAALGVMFASLAVPLAFDEQTTAAMWAVEGAGLLWIGTRQDRKLARAFGALLQALAGVGFLIGMDSLQVERALLNSAWIGTVLLAGSGLASGLWLHRTAAQRANYERGIDIAAGLWGIGWWLFGGLNEIDRFISSEYELGVVLGFVALTLVTLHAFGARVRWPLPGRAMLVLLPVALLLGLIATTDHANHPSALAGWAGWPLLILAGYALLYRQDVAADAWCEKLSSWLHPTLLWTLALLCAWEIGWQVDQQAPGVWALLPWGLVPALGLWLVSLTPPTPAWPLARHTEIYRLRGAAPLAVWLLLWTVQINLGSDGNPLWLPYLPVLNPLDVAVTLCGLAGAAWWLSLSAEQRRLLIFNQRKVLVGTVAAVALLWLSASLVRSLHYYMGTPLDYVGISDDARVHAALSMFWGLLGFGAMLLATNRGWRELWIAGAGLMGVVVIKLFFFDLDDSSQITRIVSFISIGVLMLITGYFSPLPPRSAEKEAQA